MWRGLHGSSLLALILGAAVVVTAAPSATTPPDIPSLPALQRFLATEHGVVRQAISVRHLEARNDHFDTEAWMDVRAEADANGFRYTVLAEGGSGLVRSKALRGALDQERKAWTDGSADRSWFTADNYVFEDAGVDSDGLVRVGITPRRRDLLLVNGALFLRPDDGELVRIEGAPGRSPSFWTRRVDIVRHYARINGVHLPVSLESSAQIRIAGMSTFRMRYAYEMVNGVKVQ